MNSLPWRYSVIGILFFMVGVVIVGQLVRLQFIDERHAILADAELYSGSWRKVTPARGQILDRWGHLLAGNREVYEIGVDLNQVKDPESIAFALMVVMGKDYDEVVDAITEAKDAGLLYVLVANFVSPEEVLQLKQLQENLEYLGEDQPVKDLSGLVTSPRLQRSYPEKELASNVLGFVGLDGQGYYGVEEAYNELLAGVSETVWVTRDPYLVEELPEIPPGTSLVLTLDREIQAMAESVLDSALNANGAEAGTIVIMDPVTGEILAMAGNPRMDLNRYWEHEELITGESPFNQAVSEAYEPGSVFKVLTMAVGLETKAVEPQTEFLDTGVFEIGGVYIRNWDSGAWGPQNMTGCLQHSLNVCLAWIASKVGPSDYYSYMEAFGIGHTTGVDIAGEVNGRLKVPGDGDWYEADLGTNSFGQGVSVTPVQMLMAVSALAHEGQMIVPHVVRSMINNGNQYELDPQVAGFPISPETARTLSKMLANSLEDEASTAMVPGYRVAGKTGTAEIPTPYGYTSGVTNASFVGWGPLDDPRFLVYIWFEKPTSSIWGSQVAAPVFRQVVERLVVLLDLPPDSVRAQLSGQ